MCSVIAQASEMPSNVLVPRPISSRITRLLRGRVVEDVGGLGHLDHERALAAAQLVGRADAGEEPVDDADPGASGRDEAADLGQDRDQGDLADIGALARHVRAGDQEDRAAVRAERDVVGDEVAGGQQRVEHRMPARLDLEDRLGDDLGTAVAVPRGQLGQGGQDVELGQHRAGLDQPGRLGRDAVAERGEELVFQLAGSVLGAERPSSSYSLSSGVM